VRNYFKLLALKFGIHGEPGPVNGFLYVWGKDHDQLLSNADAAFAQLIIDEPAFTWTRSYPNQPQTVYWLLNATNFAKMINLDGQLFWDNTRFQDTGSAPAQLLEETRVLAEGSPRQHFPTDEGTDGQRLRAGKTKSEGAALNYIGKLFFLTSNPAFKTLWDSLKSGKIGTTEALALANGLVNAA